MSGYERRALERKHRNDHQKQPLLVQYIQHRYDNKGIHTTVHTSTRLENKKNTRYFLPCTAVCVWHQLLHILWGACMRVGCRRLRRLLYMAYIDGGFPTGRRHLLRTSQGVPGNLRTAGGGHSPRRGRWRQTRAIYVCMEIRKTLPCTLLGTQYAGCFCQPCERAKINIMLFSSVCPKTAGTADTNTSRC